MFVNEPQRLPSCADRRARQQHTHTHKHTQTRAPALAHFPTPRNRITRHIREQHSNPVHHVGTTRGSDRALQEGRCVQQVSRPLCHSSATSVSQPLCSHDVAEVHSSPPHGHRLVTPHGINTSPDRARNHTYACCRDCDCGSQSLSLVRRGPTSSVGVA